MKNTKRIVTGLLFAATLALALMANSGEAYAQVRSGGGQLATNSGGTITLPIAIPMLAPDLLQTVGVTWE